MNSWSVFKAAEQVIVAAAAAVVFVLKL